MSKVIIQECKDMLQDIMEKINDGIDKLGGWDLFKSRATQCCKANLSAKTSDTAAVTHSEFVRAITRI